MYILGLYVNPTVSMIIVDALYSFITQDFEKKHQQQAEDLLSRTHFLLSFILSLSISCFFQSYHWSARLNSNTMMLAINGRLHKRLLCAESSGGVLWRMEKAMLSSSKDSSPQTFHRRKLPDTLIALSSPKGRHLFKEALETHTMESYFPLSEQFITQSEPSYCSLSSLAMVLNALNHDPKRTWKGVWRWVTEDTLQCESHNILCKHSLQKIQTEGMWTTHYTLIHHTACAHSQTYLQLWWKANYNTLNNVLACQLSYFNKAILWCSKSRYGL